MSRVASSSASRQVSRRSSRWRANIDFAFIDADKPNYRNYYEALLPRMRQNGVIGVDNVLWGGAVLDDKADDDNTKAIKAFNEFVASDDRVDVVMLPLADGLTLARKR